jgi:hypothetical protein
MAATSSKAKPIMSTGMEASRNPARIAMIQPQLDNKHKKQTTREKRTRLLLWVSNGCKLFFVLTLAVLMNLIFLFPKRLREYVLDNVVEQPTTGKNILNHRACHALLKDLFETISLLERVLFPGDSTLYRVASLFAFLGTLMWGGQL